MTSTSSKIKQRKKTRATSKKNSKDKFNNCINNDTLETKVAAENIREKVKARKTKKKRLPYPKEYLDQGLHIVRKSVISPPTWPCIVRCRSLGVAQS